MHPKKAARQTIRPKTQQFIRKKNRKKEKRWGRESNKKSQAVNESINGKTKVKFRQKNASDYNSSVFVWCLNFPKQRFKEIQKSLPPKKMQRKAKKTGNL